mmetsp:Transcript_45500/g.93040  ORF Transcript_45500/g.93040 Transcript_45500/m.93040 type:complete len:915 (-) Transcript_45500:330-3074(-)
MGDEDPSPARRQELKGRLRQFLLTGQREWRKDGGVVIEKPARDPAMVPIWDCIVAARDRRPTHRIPWGDTVEGSVGTVWELSDFVNLPSTLYEQLVELRSFEKWHVDHYLLNGTFAGDLTRPAGAVDLGLPFEVEEEWREGILFEIDTPEEYSRSPYSAIYADHSILFKACAEFNRLVGIGKLLPVTALPRVESPTTAIVKPSPLEPLGFKWRTCVDLSKSGVNPMLDSPPFVMPTVTSMVGSVGEGWWMAKQDIRDMFLCWKVHPIHWSLLGMQHPLTGQPYVYPVLPFGLKVSPYYACRNTESLAAVIRAQASLRAQGRASLPCLARSDEGRIRLEYLVEGRDPLRHPPSSEVYVDDFAMFAPTFDTCVELMELAADVFATVAIPEKIAKREGPSQTLTLLGFEFNSVTGVLSIPDHRRRELLVTLESILGRAAKKQSISWHELASITGRLTWAASGVEVGRVYIRHMRKPGTAVQDLLDTRRDRDRFCIPIYHFAKAVEELRWWQAALTANGGRHKWHVGSSGLYEPWSWEGRHGQQIPRSVLQFATDACRSGGGLLFDSEYRTRVWTARERRHHINILEAIMILDWCVEFGPQARGRRVLVWCDNSASVAAINRGSSRSDVITGIVRRIRLLCLEHDFHLWAVHIPGRINYIPDSLSRGLLQARVNNFRLTERSWNRWDRRFGGFDRELFAPVTGHGVRAPNFCSAADPPFNRTFKGETVWASPPADLIPRFLREAHLMEADTMVAALPSEVMESGEWEGQGSWELCGRYDGGSQIWERPVGSKWLGTKGSGVGLGIYVYRSLTGPSRPDGLDKAEQPLQQQQQQQQEAAEEMEAVGNGRDRKLHAGVESSRCLPRYSTLSGRPFCVRALAPSSSWHSGSFTTGRVMGCLWSGSRTSSRAPLRTTTDTAI